jgi:hypothetical protein
VRWVERFPEGQARIPDRLDRGRGIDSGVTTFTLWDDLHGGNATATVGRVFAQPSGAITGYTISFTIQDPRNLPCTNVERADDTFGRFGGYLIAPGLMIAGLVAIVVTRRRPTAPIKD